MGRRELKAVIDELPGSYDEVRFHPDLRTPQGLNLYIDKTEDLRCVDLDAAEKMAIWGVKAAKRLPVDGLPGEPEWLCYAKSSLVWGGIHRTKGRYGRALQCYGIASQCLRLRRKSDFTYMELFARLSLLRRDERRLDDALGFSVKGVEIAERISDRDTGIMLCNKGAIELVVDPAAAAPSFMEALSRLTPNDGRFFGASLHGLLVAKYDLGEVDYVRRRFRELERLVKNRSRLSLERVVTEWLRARIEAASSPFTALEIISEVDLAFSELGMPHYRAVLKIDEAYALYASGSFEAAASCCEDMALQLRAFEFPTETIEAVNLFQASIVARELTASIACCTRRHLERYL